jgi:hypothetical protein
VALDGPSSLLAFGFVLGLKSPMPTTPRPVGLAFQEWKFEGAVVVVVMGSLSHHTQKGQTMRKLLSSTRFTGYVLIIVAQLSHIARDWIR